MNKKKTLLSALLATAMAANAQVTINVDAGNPGIQVSPNLYGIFFEDINHAADGGLYAELISNRSFEDDGKTTPTWKTTHAAGAKISTQLINKGLLNSAQGKALQLTIAATPQATASLINVGFWSINAVQGRTYKLSFWDPKFVRFPGGCFVEGKVSPENAFHWERTIGPIEERPGHKNVNWRYRTSDGMGFDEYLQLAEDLNAKNHSM